MHLNSDSTEVKEILSTDYFNLPIEFYGRQTIYKMCVLSFYINFCKLLKSVIKIGQTAMPNKATIHSVGQ